MEATATGTAMAAKDSSAGASMPQVPLAFLESGRHGVVVKVRGRDEQRRHLENLGFAAGAPIGVASHVAGDLIVEVKGTRVALSREAAMKVVVAAG